MDVRGERECKSCGTRWSYYETGSVECPDCRSMRSVGVGERSTHTDGNADLDLSAAREAAADGDLRGALDPAADACRDYCQSRGFVSGGDLLDLDDTYLAAQELRRAAVLLGDALRTSDDAERYVLALLNGAEDGERPAPDEVPEALRAVRGLAYAAAVDHYRTDVRTYCGGEVPEPERGLLERLRDHAKRVQALDGDVAPEDSERLVEATRAIADALRGDESGVERARTRLDALAR
ncbi:TFIIB-type zinc ribbon-containing protein [Halobacterium sp. NMX12-1]|uniref:TFIIB-type zinc ribbon-containing protein n=1 Tax=Halobacterium sp. NMX12-1 TaxID=3166650 RepID=A0AAU8CAQ6_9EURY